ncbi:MAG: hypothetical protein AB7V46_13435 [Thermomicrobiales bacterium]
MMLLLALAIQSAPLLQDRAFLDTHAAWVACTNRIVDDQFGSSRSAERIATDALFGCRGQEAEVRRAVNAFSGATQGQHDMAVLLNGSREGLIERVAERRRRMAAYSAAATTWFRCTRTRIEAASSDPEQAVIDAAFAACSRDEATLRAAALRVFGREAAADRMMSESRALALEGMRNFLRNRR